MLRSPPLHHLNKAFYILFGRILKLRQLIFVAVLVVVVVVITVRAPNVSQPLVRFRQRRFQLLLVLVVRAIQLRGVHNAKNMLVVVVAAAAQEAQARLQPRPALRANAGLTALQRAGYVRHGVMARRRGLHRRPLLLVLLPALPRKGREEGTVLHAAAERPGQRPRLVAPLLLQYVAADIRLAQ